MDDAELERQYFERGKALMGKNAGGLLARLLKHKGNVALARAALEVASTKQDPREWLAATLPRNGTPYGPSYAQEWQRKADAMIAERTEHDRRQVEQRRQDRWK